MGAAEALVEERCGSKRSLPKLYPSHDCWLLGDAMLLVVDYDYSRLSLAEAEITRPYDVWRGTLSNATVYASLGAESTMRQKSMELYRQLLLERIKERLGPLVHRHWLDRAGYDYERFLLVGEASDDQELQLLLKEQFPSMKLETLHPAIRPGDEAAYGSSLMAEVELAKLADPDYGIELCGRLSGEDDADTDRLGESSVLGEPAHGSSLFPNAQASAPLLLAH